MTVLNKKQMSEEDIKLNYITPAIQPGWSGRITMETKITDGRINLRGNMAVRSTPKYADYLLYLNDPLYLTYVLNSRYGILCKSKMASGNIIVHISNDKLATIPIPLPPLKEQHRIVAKIEELLPYCDQLNK